MQTTSLHLPSDLLYLLRMVAASRANRAGGRPSVSDVVRQLLELQRHQLEAEARIPSDLASEAGAGKPGHSGGSRVPGLLKATHTERHALQRARRAARTIRRQIERE